MPDHEREIIELKAQVAQLSVAITTLTIVYFSTLPDDEKEAVRDTLAPFLENIVKSPDEILIFDEIFQHDITKVEVTAVRDFFMRRFD